MAGNFTGIGSYTEFIAEFNRLINATSEIRVVQNETMSGQASMNIGGGRWEVIMGD